MGGEGRVNAMTRDRNTGKLTGRCYNPFMATGASILEQVIKPQQGGFSSELAQYVLAIDFTPDQQARYADLADRVQDGALNEEEMAELHEFVMANEFLALIQLKARVSIKKHSPAA